MTTGPGNICTLLEDTWAEVGMVMKNGGRTVTGLKNGGSNLEWFEKWGY